VFGSLDAMIGLKRSVGYAEENIGDGFEGCGRNACYWICGTAFVYLRVDWDAILGYRLYPREEVGQGSYRDRYWGVMRDI
jgi:hypothetical protein